ncbi:SLATT domain-containing protein [Amphritea sp. 1_MG-2023]|uniref:SLATT domain-containing protein n=1 Tax=Amphritea sp. 1_MG-2023 TaxID=3062670 RepID=UPI0026E4349B|nr:SLATT domain-containing protein [Amphritea sp. 1_MG-2023]MDO6564283.1 SLATT domain-containing protein [Amphritea sp. 1_MG-2023]
MRAENPARLHAFRAATQTLLWDSEHAVESLSQLFSAVDDLAAAETRYYYRRRTSRALISGGARTFAWVSGTAGLLLPLLAATANPAFKPLAQYGYVFIAISASCLAANSLFGGTEGHIRFVTTQLELEKIITKARISWCHYLAAMASDPADIETGFVLIQAYATELHTLTLAETGRWGETLKAELIKFQKSALSKQAK